MIDYNNVEDFVYVGDVIEYHEEINEIIQQIEKEKTIKGDEERNLLIETNLWTLSHKRDVIENTIMTLKKMKNEINKTIDECNNYDKKGI